MAYIPFPTGTVLTFAGSTAPDGWLLCDGSTISRTTYARLFAVLSTTYGAGDGSTTFTLPDMRGVYPRGAGTNGTANYGGVTGHTPAGGVLGSKGGQKTAKNGLANSTSITSSSGNRNQFDKTSGNNSVDHSHSGTSGTVSSDHVHGTGNAGAHSHTIGSGNSISGGSYVYERSALNNNGASAVSTNGTGDHNHGNTGGISANHTHNLTTGGVSVNHTHTTTWDGTFSVSGTSPAQTISGDTETTPAFLAINYIIKL